MKKIRNNRTKVIATIGPSSSDYNILKDLVLNGVDVVRLNFSHGDFNDHKKTIKNIRRIRNELNVPVTILQDLQGPKIRIGELLQKNIKLVENYQFYISSKNVKGSNKEISIDTNVIDDIKENERILIDDGKIELKVVKKNRGKIKVMVIRGGLLYPRKGVNLPDSKVNVSSITDKDIND